MCVCIYVLVAENDHQDQKGLNGKLKRIRCTTKTTWNTDIFYQRSMQTKDFQNHVDHCLFETGAIAFAIIVILIHWDGHWDGDGQWLLLEDFLVQHSPTLTIVQSLPHLLFLYMYIDDIYIYIDV